MARTILVTGAAGFIASHVVEALLDKGERVVGLDNFNDYYDPARKRSNLEEVKAHEKAASNFAFVEGDIRDAALLEKVFAEHEVRAVAHLAAMAGVRASVDDPHYYYEVNLTGTLNLLECARTHKTEAFAFASTSSVYANTPTIPFVENDPADRPLAPYPASKRSAELLGHAYNHLHGLDFTALRLFTVYGPRGRPDMMAHKLLDNIFKQQEVPLYNEGKMERDWTYVTDIAAGFVAALEKPQGYQVINVGCANPVWLNEFISKMEVECGGKSNLTPMPMQSADVERTWANVEKAQELLGYQPKVQVDEGIKRFWNWYRQAVLDQPA